MFKKIAFLSLALFMILSMSVSANKVTPALDVIANNLNLIKTGLVNNDITFTADDFDRALGVSKVSNITILSLPSVTEGRLMLGSLEVMRNQTISRSNLNMLRFIPTGNNISEANFTFSNGGNDQKYTVKCTLYVLSELNFAPTISTVNESVLNLSTQKNITVFGTMKAMDPENDRLTYEIVSQPSKGILVMLDKNYGEYKYTPTADFTGKDNFEYVVCDKYGNYSDSVKVNIVVEKAASDIIYTDMVNHWAHNAAIKMTAANVMTGEKVGDSMVFNPNGTVSRCEFLAMAMSSLGIKAVNTTDTGFVDDGNIPSQYKGYVAAAVQSGYISGVDTEYGRCFYPNNDITRAEAAVILNNMLGAKQPVIKPVFADETNVPVWAEDALYALNEIGVFKGTGEGFISPYSVITRAQTAQILCCLMEMRG
jgi:S-layer homology domain.